MMGSMNFGISSPFFETFAIAKGAGAKVFSVIKNIPIINSQKNRGDRPELIKGKIIFKDVKFHYPTREEVPVSLLNTFTTIFLFDYKRILVKIQFMVPISNITLLKTFLTQNFL